MLSICEYTHKYLYIFALLCRLYIQTQKNQLRLSPVLVGFTPLVVKCSKFHLRSACETTDKGETVLRGGSTMYWIMLLAIGLIIVLFFSCQNILLLWKSFT